MNRVINNIYASDHLLYISSLLLPSDGDQIAKLDFWVLSCKYSLDMNSRYLDGSGFQPHKVRVKRVFGNNINLDK